MVCDALSLETVPSAQAVDLRASHFNAKLLVTAAFSVTMGSASRRISP